MCTSQPPSWHILHIDDDEDDYFIVLSMLKDAKGCQVSLDWAPDLVVGKEKLQNNTYQAVLVDYDLGCGSGIELIREATSNGHSTPMILLTGRGSYEVDVEAMHAGATLYLTKNEINPLLLERAIRYAIERKQAEDALQASEQRVRDTLESITDGFVSFDHDFRFTYVNETGARLLKSHRAHLIGACVWDVFPHARNSSFFSQYNKACETNQPVHFEEYYPEPLNMWVESHAYPTKDGLVVYFRDITERKQIEVRTAQHADLLDNLHDALIVTDAQQRITVWNKAAERMYEYSAQEALGMVPSSLLRSEMLDSQRSDALDQLADTGHFSIEVVQYTKTGRRLIVEGSVISRRDSQGQITGYVTANRDITKIREAEEQLTESSRALRMEQERNAWLALLPEQNPNPVLRVNADGILLYRNSAAGQLEWLGEVGRPVPQQIQEVISDSFSQASWQSYEIPISGCYYSIAAAPVPEENYTNLYIRDVTERVMAEAALRKSEHRWATTLASIGDAVIATDPAGRITFLNAVAEALTGWSQADAAQRPTTEVFKIINEYTRQPTENPVERVLAEGVIVGLANHTLLVRKDGLEIPIDDSAAPIRDEAGNMLGVVLVFRDISDRKQAAQALIQKNVELLASQAAAESEKRRLEAVLAALPVGVKITNTQGDILQTNPAYHEIMGVSGDEEDPDPWIFRWADTGEAIKPEEWPSALAVSRQEAIHNQVIEIQRSGGRRSYIINSASPLRDTKGDVAGSVDVSRDITHLKKSESLNKALNEISQELYSTLNIDAVIQRAVEASAKAVESETAAVSLYKDGRWIVRYVYGFPESVTGSVMNDDQERHALLAIRTQKPVAISDAYHDDRVNQEHMRKWGIRSVLVVPILMRGEAVGVIFFNYQARPFEFHEYHLQFGVNLAASLSLALENARLITGLEAEVTQRVQAEAELRISNQSLFESQQRWLTTLSSIGDAVIATDAEGRVTFMNPVAEEQTGWKLADAKGLNINSVFKVINELTRQPVENPVDKVLEQKKIVGLANHSLLVRKDGIEVPIDDSGAPIFSDKGEIIGTVLVFRDITERKRTEKSLEDYARHLEQSNKELESFAVVASHDLQEPLRKIESFGKYLAQSAGSALGETERDYLDRMMKASARMNKIIEDLLALSRITTRGQPFTRVDLNHVVKAVLDDLTVRITQAGGQVEVGELPVIEADEMQMHQLFQNLIGNALKFHHPEISPIVKVSACRVEDHRVEVSVKDNGIGFDTNEAGRLFQPFQRLHARSTYEGTGIGLSICRRIAERHNGSITAHSQPGEGSVFVVSLPVA